MRLVCQKAFLLAAVVALACHESTAPSPQPLSRLYLLESVDGRPLPTIIDAGAGDTTHILWSSVTLDSTGHAVTVHHLSHVYLQSPPEENTYALRQAYRMKGDSIEIGSFQPCPPGAMCVGNLHGALRDSTLTIAEWYNPYPTNPIIYLYRLVQEY